jgi:hypothetical protein
MPWVDPPGGSLEWVPSVAVLLVHRGILQGFLPIKNTGMEQIRDLRSAMTGILRMEEWKHVWRSSDRYRGIPVGANTAHG